MSQPVLNWHLYVFCIREVPDIRCSRTCLPGSRLLPVNCDFGHMFNPAPIQHINNRIHRSCNITDKVDPFYSGK